MRCISCGAEIPAQWVKAIENNECPGCGGQIMTDDSKIILNELSEAIRKMPADPQGLAGWLMSNYRIKKIGSAEPVEKFHRQKGSANRVKNSGGRRYEDEYDDEYDDESAEFHRRAGVDPDKQRALRDAARRAREKASLSNIVRDDSGEDIEDEEEEFDEEYLERILTQDASEYYRPNTGVEKTASIRGTPSDLGRMMSGGIYNYENDLVPVDSFSGSAKASVGRNDSGISGEEAKLISVAGEEGRALVEKIRYNRIKAQDAISGGGGGSFRRSG